MRCNDFDAHIDEMLSGILHPDANQHMRQCERCTSHFRARSAVQNGLRKLAAASAPGPSRATDRAVMDAFRRLQQERAARQSQSGQRPAAQVLTLPSRSPAPARGPRTRGNHAKWSGAAAAAVLLAVLGSGVHLWKGVSTVSAPTVASAPVPSSPSISIPSTPAAHPVVTASLASTHSLLRHARARLVAVRVAVRRSSPALQAASARRASAVPSELANTSSLMHLASTAAVGNMAQSASSTWPGYSNLMYCDPVVCSGPMQVVHIKVPVRQVRPNLGESVGDGYVNADVVIGPDGVARAIRVAN